MMGAVAASTFVPVKADEQTRDEIVKSIIANLKSPFEVVRAPAVVKLRELKAQGDDLEAEFVKLLDSSNPDDLGAATFALGALQSSDANVHQRLVAQLANPAACTFQMHLTEITALTLGEIGRSVVPLLLKNLEIDFDRNDRRKYHLTFGSVMALRFIGPDASVAVEPLRDFIRVKDPAARQVALQAYAAFGEASLPALDEIRACLTDEDFHVRKEACLALRALGEHAQSALPELTAFLATSTDSDEDDDEGLEPATVRRTAALAIGAIAGERVAEVEPLLLRALDDRNAIVREDVLRGIAGLGPRVGDATVQRVRDLIETRVHKLEAARTLIKVSSTDSDADHAMRIMIECAHDPNFGIPAIDALGEVGPRAEVARNVLREYLSEADDRSMQLSALTAVGRIGTRLADLLPEVEKLRNSPDYEIRLRSARIAELLREEPVTTPK